jgi:viroplasmin and RNaseH domain-containing protein
MKSQEIQERNKQIALMLGLKPLGTPYSGAFEADNNTDSNFSSFFNGLLEGESWYEFPKFHSDWNWLHEAVKKVYSLLTPSDSRKHDIIQLLGRNQKEATFIAVSDFAKLYNEKKL